MPVEDRVIVHGGGVVDLFEEPLDVDGTFCSFLPRVDGGNTSLCNFGHNSPSRYVRKDILQWPIIVAVLMLFQLVKPGVVEGLKIRGG